MWTSSVLDEGVGEIPGGVQLDDDGLQLHPGAEHLGSEEVQGVLPSAQLILLGNCLKQSGKTIKSDSFV